MYHLNYSFSHSQSFDFVIILSYELIYIIEQQSSDIYIYNI